MPCQKFKSLNVPECPDAFIIGDLAADTNYVYEFTGKFGQKYRGNVTSDIAGKITITVDGTSLRKDLFQHFSGEWTLSLFTKGSSNELIPVLFCEAFTHFSFKFDIVKPQPDPNNIVIIGCEDSDSGSGGGNGGGGGIPVIDADDGGALEPNPTGRHYTLTYHNVRDSGFSVYIDKQATIDWGDGSPLMHYPGDHIIRKTYANAGDDPIEIKVYWEVEPLNTCKVIYFMPLEGTTATAVLESLTGDIPTDLWRINLSHGWSNIPLADLPNTTKYFSLRWCSLTAQQIDELVTWCNTNVTEVGFINVALQTTGAVPNQSSQDYIDLEFAGWQIQHD